MTRWTEEHEFALLAHYARTPTPKLCEIFGRDEKSIYLKAWRMGVKKDIGYRETDWRGKRVLSPRVESR